MNIEIFGYGKPKNWEKISKNPDECGQDSFFIYENRDTNNFILGVTDGVGGYDKYDIDSGKISRQMCRNMKTYSENETDPNIIMKKAYNKIIENKEVEAGSTTVCVLSLQDYVLKSSNIGDSGYLIIRNNKKLFRSTMRGIHFPTPDQIAIMSDKLKNVDFINTEIKDATNEVHTMETGDIIILATDGFFDNISDTDDILSLNLHLYDVKKCCRLLMEETSYGYKKDDIAIIVCKIL